MNELTKADEGLQPEISNEPIDLHQAAGMMGISMHTCRRWVREGKIKGYKLGGRTYRLYPSDVQAFIKSNEVSSGE